MDDNNVKTYHFQGTHYGIDASKSAWQDGNQVTIYFLKDKPYLVAENPYEYKSVSDSLIPLVYFFIGGGLLGFYLFTKFIINNLS